MLGLAVIVWVGDLAVIALLTAPWSFIVLFAIAAIVLKKGKARLWAHGTARWASAADVKGMIGAGTGLILGRLVGAGNGAGAFWAALKGLFNGKTKPEAACRDFLDAMNRRKRNKGGPLVRLPQAIHTAVFAPTRAGKGVSLIMPFLQTCEDSCVVIDPKGENALLSSKHRARMGEVIILDPFDVVASKLGSRSDTLNVVDFISRDDPQALEACDSAAKELVVRTGEERETHFLDGAEKHISTIAATVVQYGTAGRRSLQEVSEIINHPQKLDMAIKLACESNAWGGMLARKGGELLHFIDKERASTLTTAGRFLGFLNTPALAESTRTSSFDLLALPKQMTIYVVPGLEFMKANMGWLRLVVGACMRAVVKGGLQERNLVHMILDEAAILGQMDAIEDALDKGAGFGLRCQFYYQAMGQLKKCWPKDGGMTLLSNTSKVFFGVNEIETGNMVSQLLGKETIMVESTGENSGGNRGWSEGQGASRSGGGSWGTSRNYNQQAHDLLRAEQVLALSPRTAITLPGNGVPPIMTNLIRYFEEDWLARPRGWWTRLTAAVNTFAASLIFLIVALLVAGLLTQMIQDAAEPHEPPPVRTNRR